MVLLSGGVVKADDVEMELASVVRMVYGLPDGVRISPNDLTCREIEMLRIFEEMRVKKEQESFKR